MKKQIIFIIGLPGSGKTFLVNTSNQFNDCLFLDDLKDFQLIESSLQTNNKIVITDPHLCNDCTRNKAIDKLSKFDVDIIFKYFNNDPEQCFINVQNRNDGRLIGKHFIFDLSKKYNPPKIDYTVYKG